VVKDRGEEALDTTNRRSSFPVSLSDCVALQVQDCVLLLENWLLLCSRLVHLLELHPQQQEKPQRDGKDDEDGDQSRDDTRQ